MYRWLVGLRVVLAANEIVQIVGYSCIETYPPQNVKILVQHADGATDEYSEAAFIQVLGLRLATGDDE